MRDAVLKIEDAAVLRTLNLTDLTALPTNAATQTTLAAVLAALTDADEGNALAKLEAIRVLLAAETGLAKEATLGAVLAAVDGLEGFTDTLEAKLQAIADNTDGLEATLTGVNLNTDQIEAQLTSIFNELLEKLQAGDITGLATAAKQDTLIGLIDGVEGSLTTLTGKDYATETTLAKRFGGGKTPHTATITAVGDTVTLTPAAGKALVLFWVQAMNVNPDVDPTIKIKLGATELYRAPVVSHFEPFAGAVNASLVVNLNVAAQVELTAHYLEV